MKIILVYNPKSGSALGKSELRQKCHDADITVEAFVPLDAKLKRTLAPHIREGKNIAVIGGDGTISTIAGLVAGTKATFIPLPGGTLNHFTKDLGVPQDIDEALTRLSKQKPRHIDIARVNDVYFINNSSIGIYPSSLHEREEIEPKIGKWPAAVIAAFRAFIRLRTYTVTINGKTMTTPFIFVGNNRYTIDTGGNIERSSLDKGVLTVFVAKTSSRLTLLKIAFLTLFGSAKSLTDFDELHPKSLTIDTKRQKLSVSHDGEMSKLSSPLRYTANAGTLRIIG